MASELDKLITKHIRKINEDNWLHEVMRGFSDELVKRLDEIMIEIQLEDDYFASAEEAYKKLKEQK